MSSKRPLGPHGERGRFFPADGDFGKNNNSSYSDDGDLRDSVSPTHTDDGIELKI